MIAAIIRENCYGGSHFVWLFPIKFPLEQPTNTVGMTVTDKNSESDDDNTIE